MLQTQNDVVNLVLLKIVFSIPHLYRAPFYPVLLVIFADLFCCSHVVTQDVADQLLSHIYDQNMCLDAVKTHDNHNRRLQFHIPHVKGFIYFAIIQMF